MLVCEQSRKAVNEQDVCEFWPKLGNIFTMHWREITLQTRQHKHITSLTHHHCFLIKYCCCHCLMLWNLSTESVSDFLPESLRCPQWTPSRRYVWLNEITQEKVKLLWIVSIVREVLLVTTSTLNVSNTTHNEFSTTEQTQQEHTTPVTHLQHQRTHIAQHTTVSSTYLWTAFCQQWVRLFTIWSMSGLWHGSSCQPIATNVP